MKVLLPAAMIMLGAAYTQNAMASDVYVGALYNQQDIDAPGNDFNTAGIVLGYQLNEYVAFEGRFATGTSGVLARTTATDFSHSYKEDMDLQSSLLLKLTYPIADGLNVYGLAGYTRSKIEFESKGIQTNELGNVVLEYHNESSWTRGGLSYGIGVEYQLNDNFTVFVDHQILPDFDVAIAYDQKWKSTTVGFAYRF
ncbi:MULTISPECIES: porin family protein [Pseudoalteromonas]|uniref:Outer membrane protein beta-barrel domain-containing protein n=1 Tax=Pseudoalteromonas amylolytica TaxID=1859457 RepID=A0A1S1MT38_9GAMM|nr:MULTISPECIES: porin family protein [Pseudoalteromonas]OHU85027.1 hypothetical protein BFC16_20290 [Pseudoalteromonas sp. JW3]OHU90022.1 hypothetical protein BET10_14685 [Pseudoalteromonas amylolytica]